MPVATAWELSAPRFPPCGRHVFKMHWSDSLRRYVMVPVTHTQAGQPAALANKIDHIIKSPPLMSREVPVMYPAASEAAKQIKSATSSAVPRRGTG
jgi:hypothetical protein